MPEDVECADNEEDEEDVDGTAELVLFKDQVCC